MRQRDSGLEKKGANWICLATVSTHGSLEFILTGIFDCSRLHARFTIHRVIVSTALLQRVKQKLTISLKIFQFLSVINASGFKRIECGIEFGIANTLFATLLKVPMEITDTAGLSTCKKIFFGIGRHVWIDRRG